MNTGIYKIENTVNGKLYVGSAVDIQRRLEKHRQMLRADKHPNKHLQAAWNKHGADSFAFRPLLICSRANLLLYEQNAIDAYADSYNIARIAGSQLGFKHSADTRAKMAALKRGRKQTPEHIASRSAALMGHAVSDRHRASMSQRLRGVPLSAEHRAKLSAAKVGRRRGSRESRNGDAA
jgi:group I intron endonuclease